MPRIIIFPVDLPLLEAGHNIDIGVSIGKPVRGNEIDHIRSIKTSDFFRRPFTPLQLVGQIDFGVALPPQGDQECPRLGHFTEIHVHEEVVWARPGVPCLQFGAFGSKAWGISGQIRSVQEQLQAGIVHAHPPVGRLNTHLIFLSR